MIQKQGKKIDIGILTPPIGTHSLIPLSNLINILSPQSQSLYLITGNEGYNAFQNDTRIHAFGVHHMGGNSIFLRIAMFFLMQIRISIVLIKIVKNCDIWIFFLGGENMILPMLVTKFFRKKVFLMFAGSSVHTLFYDDLVYWLKILTELNCTFSDRIILYSQNLVNEYNLSPYRRKILIAHRHFLDFTTFTVTTPYHDRPPLIGYIGRLSAEKGVQHFVQALPAILSNNQDLRVLIGGDGRLKDAIETSLQENGIINRVDLPGWISHDDLPKYLNQLRLLVLPSYTEGLPNIMLEAMACGTPVLATPVGAIPDVIQDEVTGFIMENNTPECITRNVMRALNHPDLEVIAERGRQYVEREFSFEKAVERWREVLEKI